MALERRSSPCGRRPSSVAEARALSSDSRSHAAAKGGVFRRRPSEHGRWRGHGRPSSAKTGAQKSGCVRRKEAHPPTRGFSLFNMNY